MVNYDLPWNPTRLERRLGRVRRIGQSRDVHAFNFVATLSEDGQPVIEGRILERLLPCRVPVTWPGTWTAEYRVEAAR